MGMRFLVDEDSAASAVLKALRGLGHEVIVASEVLRRGAKDFEVAQHAENLDATVVTRNKHDFWRMLAPRPESRPRKFRRAGALFAMCDNVQVLVSRLLEFDPVLRAEHERVIATQDPRFLVEIKDEQIVIIR